MDSTILSNASFLYSTTQSVVGSDNPNKKVKFNLLSSLFLLLLWSWNFNLPIQLLKVTVMFYGRILKKIALGTEAKAINRT